MAQALVALETRVTALEKEWKTVEHEWTGWYDKYRRLHARLAKREERQAVEDAPGATNGQPGRVQVTNPAAPVVKKFAPAVPGVGAGVAAATAIASRPAPMGQVPVPGVRGAVQRIVPGGATGFQQECKHGYRQDGTCRKRPTMNPANPRALKRAMRRQEAFVALARRALKGSKYRIATAGGSRRSSCPGRKRC